jgi:hypothetical protein
MTLRTREVIIVSKNGTLSKEIGIYRLKEEPMELKGEMLEAGSFIMGDNSSGVRSSVKIQHTPEFDRATQIKMFLYFIKSQLKFY